MSGTVADVRAALEKLPDTAGVIVEDSWGQQYEMVIARAIGTKTNDPGLVLKVEQTR